MDQNERQPERNLAIDRDSQINVVLNTPREEEDAIDLGRVFRNIRIKSRIFAWVLLLCMLLGLCAPVLLYFVNKPVLTVSSVVTLDYEVRTDGRRHKVDTLIAPDGTDLDLNQVTSAYVLQNAVQGMNLSYTPSLANLRDNITIERMLTEESYRNQELLSRMASDKSNQLYEQYRNTEIVYTNRFVVSLKNGFGVGSRNKQFLTDNELRELLNRILTAYNDYLVKTYADMKLPEDRTAVLDVDNLDALENLENLRDASDALLRYCRSQPASVKSYRSYRNGRNLQDWIQFIKNSRETTIDYLYSYVYSSRYTNDRDALTAGYQYQLRTAQAKRDTALENINYVNGILAGYKNDEILLTGVQEGDNNISTAQTTTAYYNRLFLQQAESYAQVMELETEIAELQDKISHMSASGSSKADIPKESIDAELKKAISTFKGIFNSVTQHMEEVHASGFYSVYAEHTQAQGRTPSFLSASNLKKMIIGCAAGAVAAFALWFLAALIPELSSGNKKENRKGKEADAK